LLSTELDVLVLVIAQVPVINSLVLSNLCEYRHKSYIPKIDYLGYISVWCEERPLCALGAYVQRTLLIVFSLGSLS